MVKRPSFRVMTYNVHRCVGTDRILSPARIAQVIAQHAPDIVALQELDVGHKRTEYADQPRVIADQLGMHCVFHPAVEAKNEHYGDAILSRHPMQLVRARPLPTLLQLPGLERRGAVWAAVECDGHIVQILNTHLGLSPLERLRQVEALLGPDWLADPQCARPRVFCGDFNAWPGSATYRRMSKVLRDAGQRIGGGRLRNTFPSRWPCLRIDHVFYSSGLAVKNVWVPWTHLTRTASDHLPVLVELAAP